MDANNFNLRGRDESEEDAFMQFYTEEQLSTGFGLPKDDTDWKNSSRKVLKRWFTCSGERWKKFLYTLIPIVYWLPRYKPRQYLIGDIAAGLTVGIVHLPQGMAYALLTTLPAVTGLYVSFFPVLIYVFFGTSKHISIGTFAVVSLMVGQVINKHVTACPVDSSDISIVSVTSSMSTIQANSTFSSITMTSSSDICEASNAKRKIEIAVALAMANGIIQIAMYIFQLGIITIYLSDHLVSGFTCGAAFHVLTSQVPKLFGLTVPRHSGSLALIYTYIDIFKTITKINWATFIISLICILFLMAGKKINLHFHDRLPIPLPWELAIVIFSTLASYFGYLHLNHLVQIVGKIPTGIQTTIPTGSDIGLVIADAIPIAIVAYAVEISMCQMFAVKHSYEIDSNQELFALGMGNIVGAFFSCYPCAASLSRSVIWEEVGAKTQITGVVSSALILVVLLWIAPLFQSLPQAALAAIIVVNLKGLLRQFEKVKPLWKVSKFDALTWVVTWTGVILLGVEMGLLVAVGFGLLTIIFRTQIQKGSVLGDVGSTGNFRNVKKYRIPHTDGKTIIFQFPGPLYFANRERFKAQLYEVLGFDPVMKASALKKTKKQATENEKREEDENIVEKKRNYSSADNFAFDNNEEGHSSTLSSLATNANGDNNNAEAQNGLFHGESSPVNGASVSFAVDVRERKVEHILLDMSASLFLDNDGAKTIKSVYLALLELDIRLSLVSCNDDVRDVISIVCEKQRPAFFLSLDRAIEYHRGEARIELDELGNVMIEEDDDTRL